MCDLIFACIGLHQLGEATMGWPGGLLLSIPKVHVLLDNTCMGILWYPTVPHQYISIVVIPILYFQVSVVLKGSCFLKHQKTKVHDHTVGCIEVSM